MSEQADEKAIARGPKVLSMWSVSNANVAFTATVPRLIPAGGFTVTANPSGVFEPDPATGQAVYVGRQPMWARVTIDYSYVAPSVPTAQTLLTFIATEPTPSIYSKQKEVSFVPLGPQVLCEASITDVVHLAPGQFIQLAGMYSATAMLTLRSISYAISEAA